MSDAIWLALIVILGQIVTEIFARLRARDATVKIEEIHKATNSIVKQLVEKSGEEGHERGVREEREKHQ